MTIFDFFMLGIGLSMDAFAVAICKGLKMPKINYKQTFLIALFFGGFQALMPFLGWLLGSGFSDYIKKIDHWIAFILLAFIGGKMIYEALHSKEEEESGNFDIKELFLLAIATSIDALAVGISLAFLNTDIWSASILIGVVTFVIAAFGGLAGFKLGAMAGKRADVAGGLVLIFIGVKILLEHTGII